jgi:hypothetical protein
MVEELYYKVLNPDEVTEFINLSNPSSHTMALKFT